MPDLDPPLTPRELAAMPGNPAGTDALAAVEDALNLMADAMATPSIRDKEQS